MDQRSLLGIILIVLIMMFIPTYMEWINGGPLVQPPAEQPVAESPIEEIENQDTAAPNEATIAEEIPPAPQIDSLALQQAGIRPAASEEIFRIESKLLNGVVSTANGANLSEWTLKSYESFEDSLVNLVSRRNGTELEVVDKNGKSIVLTEYTLHASDQNPSSVFLDEDNPQVELTFFLPVDQGRIVKKMTFYHDQYAFNVAISFENLHQYLPQKQYYFGWRNGLSATEFNKTDDYTYATARIMQVGEMEYIEVTDSEDGEVKEHYSGTVDWVGMRTKYFLNAIIPSDPKSIESATLYGVAVNENNVLGRVYSTLLEVPYSRQANHTDQFTVYLGPLNHTILDNYGVGLDDLVLNSSSYEGFFRWISLLVLPALTALYSVIPNYGWVIIIFAIGVKILLHPLTKKSYVSMAQLQQFQPLIADLREKYKNDQQRLNKEMMKLYKEHGVNPVGGCLPMLLQMPLLFALFIVFRSTIQLRGEPWVAWITDLSAPDALYLGFSLPFIGDSISVLPILMGVSMLFQSQMTMTDPKQKAMIYIMPVFLTFIFYAFPSGLNLYYTIFNLLTMFQTRWIKSKLPQINKNGTQGAALQASQNGAQAKGAAKPQPSKRPQRKKKKSK